MKTITKISMVAVLAFVMAACCNCGKSSPKIGSLEEVPWTLIEFDGQSIANSNIVLTFDGEKKMVYGKVPCNNFFGGYTLYDQNAAQNIKISNVGRTQKFCPNTEIEDKFGMSLPSVTKVKIDGEHLIMVNAEGKQIAILAAKK